MCLGNHFSDCVVGIFVVVVFFSVLIIAIFIFVIMFIFTTVPFAVNVTIIFFAVIVVINAMLMFSNLVVLCVSHFTVNSVDK